MRPLRDGPRHPDEAVNERQTGLFGEEGSASELQIAQKAQVRETAARIKRRSAARADREALAGEPLQVPIEQLEDDPQHPRAAYPSERLDELAKDIAERGVLQAIVVAPPDPRGRFRIRFGVQRWRAARLAGLNTVPIAVRAKPTEVYDHVAENLKRHGLSPLELARFIRSRVEAGESNAHIAQKLAVDQTTVAHHLTLLELPPILSALLESGRCTSPRTLHELQKLHAEQPEALAALLEDELPVTRTAVAALRTPAARSTDATPRKPVAPRVSAAGLIQRSQALCDQLDRLLAQLADQGTGGLASEHRLALRARLLALAQRLGA